MKEISLTGKQLKRLRNLLKATQKTLAEDTGYKPNTIAVMEMGRRNVSKRLAMYLHKTYPNAFKKAKGLKSDTQDS